MPNNNPVGSNAYSGPTGEREPAYGAVEREKVLTRSAPVGSPDPVAAGKRAQRHAERGERAAPAPPSQPLPHAAARASAEQEQTIFWQSVLSDPEASPLAKEYAQAALGG